MAIEYWKKVLADPPFMTLPTDYARHTIAQVIESEETLAVSEPICKNLLKLSLVNDYRPFTIVLAAYSILLHKYTREKDMILGSSTPECNPLLLRVGIDGEDSLQQVVQKVHDIEEKSLENDYPFDDLIDELFDRANMTESNKQSMLVQARCLNAVDVTQETLEAVVNCDWTLFVEQERDSKRLLPLKLRMVFNTLLFKRRRMKETLVQMQMVLEKIGAEPTSHVKDVSLFSRETPSGPVLPDPYAVLSDKWEGSVMSFLTKWAENEPDRIAVVHNDTQYTYKEINERSNQVANFLIAGGIQKEDVVTLYAHRSTAIVIGIMGILKSGATFSVIDPAYPVDRQNIYLRVAQPKAIVQMNIAGELPQAVEDYIKNELTILCRIKSLSVIDKDNQELNTMSKENPNVEVGPNNVATLSFTSGSTGIPKGVRGRHISLTHFYPWMMEKFGLNRDDRFTMLSGIAHDPIQRDVFTPLFMGAQIRIPDAEDIMNPGHLSKWMAEHEITVSHLTPAMAQLLNANALSQMPTLKLVFLVGDILTKRDVMRLQGLAANVTVVNMYGTTETQRAVSYFSIKNDQSIGDRKEILPAGTGMKDVQLLILTETNQMAGVGELGEIYVRSPHLCKEYLGLPDVTKAKFLGCPFNDDPLDRMYRTGDLGRYMPDGIVECVGRADDQVKIRGFRIELGEIDTFLGQHPCVRENVTMVRRDANEEKTIISYFVPHEQGKYDIDDMRTFLKGHLPSYSIPSVFVPLFKMPLTPNAKIDKAKLPFPDAAIMAEQIRSTKKTDESLLSPLHKQLVKIWEETLKRPVDIMDNFFDVGGHSITATRVTFQMRKQLKRANLPLNLLYSFPTIDALVQRMNLVESDPTADFEGLMEEESKKTSVQWNVEEECVLCDEVTTVGKNLPVASVDNPNVILLTGTTGFLGAFLIRSILTKFPTVKLICHARAKTAEAGMERVIKNLKAHLIWNEDYKNNLSVVIGDLSLERIGIEASIFDTLADEVDMIIHNGALVHWVYPYHKLKSMNVTGTVELLKLATTKKIKSFHFISSTAVFESQYYSSLTSAVHESEPLKGGSGLSVGYGQSKYVSEQLIMIANKRGVPTTIFRPGYVTGHTATGVTNVDDYLVRLIKGCIEMGCYPRMQNRVNMCPVDFIADAIVTVSSQPTSNGKCFHMCNPHVFRFSDYFGLLKDYGYEVEEKEYVEWRDTLESLTLSSRDNALYPLLHFVLDDLPQKSKSCLLDTTQLFAALKNTGIECNSINSVMGTYLAYLVKIKYIDAPLNPGPTGKTLPTLNIEGEIFQTQRSGN